MYVTLSPVHIDYVFVCAVQFSVNLHTVLSGVIYDEQLYIYDVCVISLSRLLPYL